MLNSLYYDRKYESFTIKGYRWIEKQQNYKGEMYHFPQRTKKNDTFTYIAQRTKDTSQT